MDPSGSGIYTASGSACWAELDSDPELWVERIPYPETRLYTKKVLGNLWAYLNTGSSTGQCTK